MKLYNLNDNQMINTFCAFFLQQTRTLGINDLYLSPPEVWIFRLADGPGCIEDSSLVVMLLFTPLRLPADSLPTELHFILMPRSRFRFRFRWLEVLNHWPEAVWPEEHSLWKHVAEHFSKTSIKTCLIYFMICSNKTYSRKQTKKQIQI